MPRSPETQAAHHLRAETINIKAELLRVGAPTRHLEERFLKILAADPFIALCALVDWVKKEDGREASCQLADTVILTLSDTILALPDTAQFIFLTLLYALLDTFHSAAVNAFIFQNSDWWYEQLQHPTETTIDILTMYACQSSDQQFRGHLDTLSSAAHDPEELYPFLLSQRNGTLFFQAYDKVLAHLQTLSLSAQEAETHLQNWKTSEPGQPLYAMVPCNIRSLEHLERLQKGYSRRIYDDFGTQWFARYTQSILEKQTQAKHQLPPSEPSIHGFVLLANQDYNSAFLREVHAVESFCETAPQTIFPWYTEHTTEDEDYTRLADIAKRTGPFHFGVVAGHGNMDQLTLHRDTGRISVSAPQYSLERVLSLMLPEAPLLLSACFGGEINGVAQYLSSLGHITIGARTETLGFANWEWENTLPCQPFPEYIDSGAAAYQAGQCIMLR